MATFEHGVLRVSRDAINPTLHFEWLTAAQEPQTESHKDGPKAIIAKLDQISAEGWEFIFAMSPGGLLRQEFYFRKPI